MKNGSKKRPALCPVLLKKRELKMGRLEGLHLDGKKGRVYERGRQDSEVRDSGKNKGKLQTIK